MKLKILIESTMIDNPIIVDNLIQALDQAFPSFRHKMNSIDVDIDKLEKIGEGDQGQAFAIPYKNIVVKITEDKQEANASAIVMSRPIQGVNRITFVGEFSKPLHYPIGVWGPDELNYNPKLYVIVQDKLNTKLTTTEKFVADKIFDFLLNNKKLLSRIIGTIEEKSAKLSKIMLKQHGLENNIASYVATSIFKAIFKLQHEGIEFFDIHHSNLGKDSLGNYVLFDLGISRTSTEIVRPTLETIDNSFKIITIID